MTALAEPRHWLADRSRGAMAAGSVLLHAPSHAFQSPGGGENQLVQTGLALEARGVAVRPFSAWTDRLADARAIHLFGMSREGLELARVAKAMRVPVVLSTICWYEPRATLSLAENARHAAKGLAGWAWKRACPRWPGWRRQLLGLADAVLPNSRAEAGQLVSLFATDPKAIRVVPNGVDPRFADATPDEFRARVGPDEFVLYVGRIEPRKNVLGLAKACRSLGRPLVVIGDPTPGRGSYVRACVEAAGGGLTWVPAVPHGSSLLASAYAAAKVFALPSWFETPGLAALEAGLAGRPVVVTPYGCAAEYFGNRAHYARPGRVAEIASAIESAWTVGPNSTLARHLASHYLWSDVARQTAEVYDEVAG